MTRGAGRASAEDRLAALIELKQAVADDKTAREDAAAARDRLRAAALAAVDAGATAVEVAELAGVRRATIHEWSRTM
ncbi:hypothetical protein [uncultured Actinomyces sp.]|uniref:hypothetical protein n=1 Tax=uncultured Actinomyces sp. TaxID=249061 RepID=UPI0028F08769|nr:hypothetical protein [uncultured Actinomyces sp.]